MNFITQKDAEIIEHNKQKFKELCQEYKHVFPSDSSHISKTTLQLITDMGDSPPISQVLYTLP